MSENDDGEPANANKTTNNTDEIRAHATVRLLIILSPRLRCRFVSRLRHQQWGSGGGGGGGTLVELTAQYTFAAYLRGGSVDFSLAAMAEEVAREKA